jgi:hypothetical protein
MEETGVSTRVRQMITWTDDIDPATISYEVLKSERARRNSARRINPSGGVV